MLKNNSQLKLSLSPYQGIYDAIIPANNLLQKMKENIDFSFVNPMLRKQYWESFGRPAKEPEMMFKLLFLKKLYDLPDETLISNAQTDMVFEDEKIRDIRSKDDRDARFGHKTSTIHRMNRRST